MAMRQLQNVAFSASNNAWCGANLSKSSLGTCQGLLTSSLQAMCFTTTSWSLSLIKSVGTFALGKFNAVYSFAFPFFFLAFATASGIQWKFSLILGVTSLYCFSYSSKWWLAMCPWHVEFDPSRKHSCNVFFGCLLFSTAFVLSALNFHISNIVYNVFRIPSYLQIMHYLPSRFSVTPVFAFLNTTWILSLKIVRRSRVESFLDMSIAGAP